MKKTAVLTEKPSVGRDIARVLNCHRKGKGYFEGDRYIVTWALGHLVTLSDPEEYHQKYKSWNLEDLPMLPDPLKLKVIKQSAPQYKVVKEQLTRKDVDQVVIATDAGREGELVARWIIAKAQVKKPLQRLWISSVTDKAIKEGFRQLKPGKDYENLYAAAVARAEADWLVGINATRALTCKYNAQLSCGRVQTPTLAMIAHRQEEIKNFKPRDFYGLKARAKDMFFTWYRQPGGETRTFDQEVMQGIIKAVQGQKARVESVESVRKKKSPPLLYNLTELQKDSHKKYGYSAKETLGIMQGLYEHHKIVTYPRTDSRYLTGDMVDTLRDRIKACGTGFYQKYARTLLQGSIKPGKQVVDDKKVSDHHAIIPTEQSPLLSQLSEAELKIYDMIVRRFLAVLYPDYTYEQTTITVRIGEERFKARGKKVVSPGWKEVYERAAELEEDEDEAGEDDFELQGVDIRKGEILDIQDLVPTRGVTKPPPPFNEGTLLAAMEKPMQYMDPEQKDLKKIAGETGGLGTVATRGDIIEKLFNNFLMEKQGQNIFLTSKGRQLLGLVPRDLRSPELTAAWEQKLAAISRGGLSPQEFTREMRTYTQALIREIKQQQETFKHDNLTGNKCPACGQYMLEVKGKKGKMLVCQDRECGHRKNMAQTSNARCPQCHKKLLLKGEGPGQVMVCACGFREKLSSFKARNQKGQERVARDDVQKFLQKQKKSEPEMKNTALADALAKWKDNE